jgi:hypothetical protein
MAFTNTRSFSPGEIGQSLSIRTRRVAQRSFGADAA